MNTNRHTSELGTQWDGSGTKLICDRHKSIFLTIVALFSQNRFRGLFTNFHRLKTTHSQIPNIVNNTDTNSNQLLAQRSVDIGQSLKLFPSPQFLKSCCQVFLQPGPERHGSHGTCECSDSEEGSFLNPVRF